MKLGINQRIVFEILKERGPLTLEQLLEQVALQEHRIADVKKVLDSLSKRSAIEMVGGLYQVRADFVEDSDNDEGGDKKYRIRDFVARQINDQNSLEFFVYTYQRFRKLIEDSLDVPEGDPRAHDQMREYLSLTDQALLRDGLSDRQFIFKEFVYHSQNRQNGINYSKYERQIRDFLCDYDPTRFLQDANPVLPEAIGGNEKQKESFVETAKCVATYLADMEGESPQESLRESIVQDLSCGIDLQDAEAVFNRFKEKIPTGFGEALVFDVLKEFDPRFDFPKPDLHVRRVMAALYSSNRDELRAQCFDHPNRLDPASIPALRGDCSAMELYLGLMNRVNGELARRLGRDIRLPNYVLDKMIYLVCSGKLYLQKDAEERIIINLGIKKEYLQGIIDERYAGTALDNAVLNEIMGLL